MTAIIRPAADGMICALLSGMFGMNVGGIPGIEYPLGFWVVSGLIGLVGVTAYVVLKWRRWL